jgi:hypothetical protein
MNILRLLARLLARLGERAYAGLFWAVMGGYAVRVLLA